MVIDHFEGQKIIAIGAGDEFSIAVDKRFYPWGWGRAEQGQVVYRKRVDLYEYCPSPSPSSSRCPPPSLSVSLCIAGVRVKAHSWWCRICEAVSAETSSD